MMNLQIKLLDLQSVLLSASVKREIAPGKVGFPRGLKWLYLSVYSWQETTLWRNQFLNKALNLTHMKDMKVFPL